MSALVKELFHPKFLDKVSKKNEMVTHLSRLHKYLSEMDQDIKRPQGFENTAVQLASPRYLDNDDKEVRILVICCIVDVLRLFAPYAPYSNMQLSAIFEVLIAQLRSLSTHGPTTGIGTKIGYVVLSLARVKSCVVLVELAQSGHPEQLDSFFQVLIKSVRPHHDEEVLSHIESILECCLEECDSNTISQDMMESLLLPLIPSNKAEAPVSYTLVQAVLRRCTLKLQTSLNTYINNLMASALASNEDDADNRNEGGTNAEVLSVHLYPLIYELHKISSGLLVNVIPNISSMQLQAEEEEVRIKAVQILGALYASPHAAYATTELPGKYFQEFLNRFIDVSKHVRLQLIEQACIIMKNKAQNVDLVSRIEDCLMKRLKDTDAEVRLASMTALSHILLDSPLKLKCETVVQMVDRVKDRNTELRKFATETVGKAYYKHISSVHVHPHLHTGISMDQLVSKIPEELWLRLSNVPSHIVNCWGFPEIEFKLHILKIVQEYIIPKSISQTVDGDNMQLSQPTPSQTKKQKLNKASMELLENTRSMSLLLFFYCLNHKERWSLLGGILGYKTKVRNELNNFLKYRAIVNQQQNTGVKVLKGKKPPASSNNTALHEDSVSLGLLRRTKYNLLQMLPVPLTGTHHSASAVNEHHKKSQQMLEKLQETKDKHIFRLLASASGNGIDDSLSIEEHLRAREDLQQRLDSKSLLGEYCGVLYNVVGTMCCSSQMIDFLLQSYNVESKNNSTTADDLLASELLELLAKCCPYLFRDAVVDLTAWVSNITEQIIASIHSSKTNNYSVATTKKLSVLKSCLNIIQFMCASNVFNDESKNKEDGAELASVLFHNTVQMNPQDSDLIVHMSETIYKLANCGCCDDKLLKSMKQQLFASISDKGSKKDSISKSTKKKKLSSNGSNKNSKNVDLVRRGLDLTMLSVLIQLPMLSSDEALTDRLLEYVRFDTLKLDLDGQEMEVIDDIDDTFVSSLCATIRLWVRILIANEIGNEKQQQHSDTNKSTAQNGTHKSNAVESSGKTRGKRASSSNASSAGDDDSEAVPEDSYNKSFASNNTVLLNDYHRQRSLNEDMIEMLEIMFQCIHTKGEYLVDAIQFPVSMGAYEGDVLETYRSRLRLTCASSIFELLKLHHISKALTVMQWQVLGWSLLDSNLQNRRLLLSQFGDMIQRNPIHPRFLAYPCLLASSIVHTNNEIQISSSSEYTALYNMAEQYLLFAIKRLRCTQEELSVKASLSTGSHEEIAKLKALAQDHMPEAILPYVLYLLSHHPDFPKSATIVEKEDQLRLKCVIQSIRMIVNALLDSLPGDNSAGNLSLIFKQVNMISQYYKDKLDEDNLGLHFVTQVTTKILKQRIQTVENVQAYPGDIRLPMDLYEAYDNSPLSIDQKAIKTAVLIEAEPAVDKVLGFTITTGHTATRRGGGLARSKPVESKKRVYKADSDDEGALKAKVKKSVNAKAKSKPVPEPPKRPASSRPQRNAAKAVTSYKEQKESDREMMEWDQLAGQEKEEKEARRSRGSAGSNQSLLMPTYHSSNDDSDFSPRKLKQTRLK